MLLAFSVGVLAAVCFHVSKSLAQVLSISLVVDDRVCQVQCLRFGPTYILGVEYCLELLIIDLRGLAQQHHRLLHLLQNLNVPLMTIAKSFGESLFDVLFLPPWATRIGQQLLVLQFGNHIVCQERQEQLLHIESEFELAVFHFAEVLAVGPSYLMGLVSPHSAQVSTFDLP